MHYNIKRILCSTALTFILALMSNTSLAQGTVSLADEAPQLSNNPSDNFLGVDDSIPDEIALFETNNQENEIPVENSGMINPGGQVASEAPVQMNADAIQPGMPMMPDTASTAPEMMDDTITTTEETIAAPVTNEDFGEGLLSHIDNELFSQMSDLEKQTALLTLELRREKVKNEIEAIKAQREKAQNEIKAKEEEKALKRAEWEKEQEKKILEEKQKLKRLAIELEKVRQEKVLNSYKDGLLKTTQDWIKNNEKVYKDLSRAEDDRETQAADFKKKLAYVSSLAAKAGKDAETARDNYNREVANLQTQISILKSRLEAERAEKEKSKANPFADAAAKTDETKSKAVEEEEIPVKLAEEYVVMEIRGKGDSLVAKLINKAGDPFLVQKGTSLQSGHVVDEITQTYVRAEKNGIKDYVYFSAGGILEKEPLSNKDITKKVSGKSGTTAKESSTATTLRTTPGVPSLGRGMFVK